MAFRKIKLNLTLSHMSIMFSKMPCIVFSHDIQEVPTKHDTLKQTLCLVNALGVGHTQVAKDTPHWMGPYLGNSEAVTQHIRISSN